MGNDEAIPCHVFTPEWVAGQRRRYESHPPYARPLMYDFWTADDFRDARDVVERWVDRLPGHQQSKVVPRLRDPGQFRQTYNELAVGDSLTRPGRALEYEPALAGLTPDWLVADPALPARFLVEVVSSNQPENRDAIDRTWEELRLRLEALPFDAYLHLDVPFPEEDEDEPFSPEGAATQKEIVRRTREWLKGEPAEGSQAEFEGVVVRFLARLPRGDGLSCGCGSAPFLVDGGPVRDAVREKAKRYGDLAASEGLSLVVCVVPAFATGRGIEELEDAVLGTPKCRLVRTAAGAKELHYRASDGLFARYRGLSAVTLLDRGANGLTHTVLRNPDAFHPLAEGAF